MNDDHGDHGGDDDPMSCPMKMTFHGGTCEVILFPKWATTDVGAFVAAFFGFFLLSLLYEGLKYFRETLRNQERKSSPERMSMRHYLTSRNHIFQSCLHFVQVSVSYILMLIVMTFNLWLCLAVVSGATVGYYIFGWIRQNNVDVTEHCQ